MLFNHLFKFIQFEVTDIMSCILFMQSFFFLLLLLINCYLLDSSNDPDSKDSSDTPVTPTTPKFTGSLSRFSSSNSMFYLDLDVKESKVSIFKNPNLTESSPKEPSTCDNVCGMFFPPISCCFYC